MKQTIYIDVLVIINIYINYGLLLLTGFIRKVPVERFNILLGSLFGGFYSLVILIDISDWFISLSRIPALAVMTMLAFGCKNIKELLKTTLCFFGVNLMFAGTMFALWFFVCPENMFFNSGVVYFGIDAITLVIFTVVTYIVIRLLSVLNIKKVPVNLTYIVHIYFSEKEFVCKGLYDSGNSLCDPFTGECVTIVNFEVFNGIFSKEIFDNVSVNEHYLHLKLIPLKTLSGTDLLPSIRVDKMIIKGLERKITLEKPEVVLCKEKIHGGTYGALLNPLVFENNMNRNGDGDVLHI